MLEGLDRIAWNQLSHAYGNASDVPGLIRGLAAGTADVRQASLDDLFGNIWHQGTVYEATAFAVPFLLELVADAAIPERSHILYLLQAISEGWLDCQRYAEGPGKFVPPQVAAQHAAERPYYQAAHEAVARGFEVLSGLLGDDDAVRVGSAFVLATLTERRGDAASVLLDAIDGAMDDGRCGALLLAMLVLVQNSDDRAIADVAVRRFESVLEESGLDESGLEEPDSRVAALSAGIALLQLNRADAVPRVLEIARPRLVEDSRVFSNIPWKHANKLYSLIAKSLSGMPRERLDWIIEGLNHADHEVRSSAMYCGAGFCEEFRRGPAELAPRYAKLVDSADAKVRKLAIGYLRGMGAAGFDCLRKMVEHPSADVRAEAAEQLKQAEKSRKERESWLIERRPFLLPSVASLRRTIDRHQGSRRWDDEQKVRDAVINLGFRGAQAAPAVEQLRPLTERDSPWIRIHAIRALWKITHDPALVVPLLQANLRPEPAAFLVLDCLKQIGAPARAVVPELRGIIDSEQRYFKSWEDVGALDEAFCPAAAEAVRAIEALSSAVRTFPSGRNVGCARLSIPAIGSASLQLAR